MASSLQEQLLKAGLAKPEQARKLAAERKQRAKATRSGKPVEASEVDLARAYAERARAEQAERDREIARQQELARQRKARREQISQMLEGKALNQAGADLPRHFQYGDKIRRIYLNAEQLRELNSGRLAVAQWRGRYLLVSLELADRIAALEPDLIALRVDPNAPQEGGSDYEDPRYQVPDDLVW